MYVCIFLLYFRSFPYISLINQLFLDRPAYQQDPERIYGFPFAGLEIKFRVGEETLYVCEVNEEEKT